MRAVLARVEPRGHRVVRVFSVPEATVADVVEAAGGERGGLEVTVCARNFEVEVDVFFSGGHEDAAAQMVAAVEARFGDAVFAWDESPLAALVLDLAREAGWSLATAESCTGGLVAAALTAIPGASDVFLGGAVSYANEAKEGLLGVPADVLAAHGAVSEQAARAMAEGARSALRADVAVAVTGIAGPGGGTPEKPVGLVHIAVASPEETVVSELRFSGDREEIRLRAATLSLHEVRRLLTRSVTK